ncbi:Ankyrin repeat-containing protein [Vitis vinifera]|uniref:Ankyrin repeat-containing protein n=1 Tax=Vitis vinifera TaxID=29760 RepID=A0A438GZR8_VITVI|nr:Ankyrin repeat-containing protein [Vitis vinifera]
MKGDTPLHTASRTGCLGMVEQFISSSKALCYDIERIRENEPQDLLMVNQEGDTALHVAVRYGHLDVVELLGHKGMTALHAAVVRTHQGHERGNDVPHLISLESLRRFVYNIVFKVLEYLGGSVSNQTDDIMAILLVEKEGMVKETDIFGWTPLHYAAQLGYLEATRKLLESQCGESKVVKYILEVRGWESLINEIDNEGNTALHLAAIYGHYNSVSILARDGVDKRATNKKYLKAIDIVQTNMDLGEIKKYWIMRKLEDSGAQQSLERLIVGVNTDEKINDNEGLKEGINGLELREDRERISLDASESFRDRNNEVVKKKDITSKYLLKDVSNTHLLVATLIATVTLQPVSLYLVGTIKMNLTRVSQFLNKGRFQSLCDNRWYSFPLLNCSCVSPLFCFTGTKLPFASSTFHKICRATHLHLSPENGDSIYFRHFCGAT